MQHPTATTQLDWFTLERRLRDGAPLVLGVGSYEQHGPHLPMTTDAIIADALAGALAEAIGGIVLPTIGYGAPSRPRSGGGDLFPAPSVRLGTLLDTVEQAASGALDAGARRLIVLSWHMENASVLWDAVHGATRGRPDGVRALVFEAPWDYLTAELERELFPEGEPQWPSDHAGRLETALLRHLAPELAGAAPAPAPFRPREGYDVLPTPSDAVPSTGVVNDARAVTADIGRRCFDAMVAGMAAAVAGEAAG